MKTKEKKPTPEELRNNWKTKVIKQYLQEKMYAVKLRQVKINTWNKIEEAYNGAVQKTLISRSNLHVPFVFKGIQDASAKIGSVPTIDFHPTPEGDRNAAPLMKHTVKDDLDSSNFEQIWADSKIEVGIYGRTFYEVIPGNDRQRVELCDSLAMLISPIATKMKGALYAGRQFIYKTIDQLEEEADKYDYDKSEIELLKQNKIPAEIQNDSSSEAAMKNIRAANMGLANTTNYGSKVSECTKWFTYIDKQLYRLFVANDVYLLSAKPASKFGIKQMPFFSWGTYPRGITFWCSSLGGLLLDSNLAMDVALNQQIDNNTYRNFGQYFVSSKSGLKQGSIVPRPLGLTPVEVGPNERIQDHIMPVEVPEIGDAMATMQTVKGIAEEASGFLPPKPYGKSKLKVTEMAQIQAEIDDKVKTMRSNAIRCFEEMCQFIAECTKERLTKPRKVKIFGPTNLDVENVTKKNFKGVTLKAVASPGDESAQNKAMKQKAKIQLYELLKDDPKIPGQISLRRMVAKTFISDPDELEDLFKQDEPGLGGPVPGDNPIPNTGQPNTPQPPPSGTSAAMPTNEATPTNQMTGEMTAASTIKP